MGGEGVKSESGEAGASRDEIDINKVGISFAANDSITLGLNYQETELKTAGAKVGGDEEVTMVSIGYNLGGLGIQIQYAQVDNVLNSSGSDAEALQIRTIQKF